MGHGLGIFCLHFTSNIVLLYSMIILQMCTCTVYNTCIQHKHGRCQNPTNLFEVDMNLHTLLGALVQDLNLKVAEGLIMNQSGEMLKKKLTKYA